MEAFVELTILSHLVFNETYTRKVIPFLNEDFFHTPSEKLTFQLINDYVGKYNSLPTREALLIDLQSKEGVPEEHYRDAKIVIENLRSENTDLKWLCETTEKFCQQKALYNAIMESIGIMEDKSGKRTVSSIPELLTTALSLSFDTHVGHDYIEDSTMRWEYYHTKAEKLRFDIDILNKVTKGGIERKTLTVILGGTGVGKTLVMCHQSAFNMMDGKNVLYITNEMAEEKIAERIDANLLGVTVDELMSLSREMYDQRVQRVRERTVGKLIIKEYPTATAHVGHFRALLKELRLKRNFTPDVIYVDYINICTSSRVRAGTGVNSYTLIKSIAEELRGLAVEQGVPIITATQTTRQGYGSTDVGLEDTSESFGLPATADFMYAIMQSEELEKLGQMMIKQLKNRFGDPAYYRRFVVGIDKSRMRLFNLDDKAQSELAQEPGTKVDQKVNGKDQDETPVFDRGAFGGSMRDRAARLKNLVG